MRSCIYPYGIIHIIQSCLTLIKSSVLCLFITHVTIYCFLLLNIVGLSLADLGVGTGEIRPRYIRVQGVSFLTMTDMEEYC